MEKMQKVVGRIRKPGSGIRSMGLLTVALLGLWHLQDVGRSVAVTGHSWLHYQYAVLLLVVMALLLTVGILCYGEARLGRQWHPAGFARIFPVAVFGLGCCYLMVLPPLSAPDEVSHYISAYQLSNRMLNEPVNVGTGHVLVRAEDWFLEDVDGVYPQRVDGDGYLAVDGEDMGHARVFGQTLTEETYRMIYEKGILAVARTAAGQRAVSIYPPVVTTPLVYVPQALGISLGRVLGLGSLGLLYLGRIFNLGCFVLAGWLAMRRLPFGQTVLFGVCLLPMPLHLAASLSYDAMIMGGVFLFTAWCLFLAFEAERVRWWDVAGLAAIMAVVGPCKMVYAVFMGLCLLIPIRKFGGYKQWAAAAAVVFGAWAAAMFLVNRTVLVTYAAQSEGYVPWTGEVGYSLSYVLHHPGQVAGMFYNTLLQQGGYWHLAMVGAYLGNLDPVLDVPYVLVCGFTGGLLTLAFRKPRQKLWLTGGRRIWIWVLCAACVLALMLSMLIAWTPLSAQVVAGVQGRYFLPFLPVLLMSVKNDWIVLTKNADRSILYLMCCANGYVLLRLFSIVCLRL